MGARLSKNDLKFTPRLTQKTHTHTVWEGRLPESAPAKNLVGIRNKKEHTRRRRTWLRALSPVALKHYEGFLVTRTQQMIDLLLGKISKPMDMSEWMGFYTYVCGFCWLTGR